jgi:hypothetical protein
MINNQKKQVEDIFAETDKTALRPPRVKQPATGRPAAAGPVLPNAGVVKKSKAPIFVLIVFIVGVILGVGWLVLSGTILNQNKEAAVNSGNSAASDTASANINSQSVDLPIVNDGVVDSDGDGLTDEEERELGTSLTNKDTDQDGLFDREEVEVYKTDPLKKDTDGDGNDDGEEVANGFNPNGAGKLLDLQAEIEKL